LVGFVCSDWIDKTKAKKERKVVFRLPFLFSFHLNNMEGKKKKKREREREENTRKITVEVETYQIPIPIPIAPLL
jgi:hypothetical protein